jgi:nitroreductase
MDRIMDRAEGPDSPGPDLYRVLMKRRSARAFRDQEIPDAWIEQMIDVAANAPSGGNMQPFSIILVRSVEKRKELAHLAGDQPWVRNAPVSMIFCLDFYRIKKWAEMCRTEFRGEEAVNHFLIGYADVMIAAQSVAILAESYGLASVYIGTVQHEINKVRKCFKIPKFVLPVMLLCIGHPKSIPLNVPKLSTNAILHQEEYRKSANDEIRRTFDEKYGAVDQVVEKYLERAFVEALEHDKQAETSHVGHIKEEMKRLDIRNNAQFLFKLRYPANAMVGMNRNLIQSFKNAGFEMFAVNRVKEKKGSKDRRLKEISESDRPLMFPGGADGKGA